MTAPHRPAAPGLECQIYRCTVVVIGVWVPFVAKGKQCLYTHIVPICYEVYPGYMFGTEYNQLMERLKKKSAPDELFSNLDVEALMRK